MGDDNMSDTPYSPIKPPKTITQVKNNDYLDFSSVYTWVLLISVGISFALVFEIGVVQSLIIKGLAAIILICWIYTWFKYASTPDKVAKYRLALGFRVQDLKGNHTINKFSATDVTLQKIVPIVNIYMGGIIEFKDKKWGILIETHPIRISDEDKERKEHEKKMEKVVNCIPANTHFKTIACSRLEPRKPILEYLLDITKKSTGKKATDLHLMSLYNKISEDNSKVISWRYYVFQSLGEQPSLEAAKIQYGAVVPGLLKNMRSAKLDPVIIEDQMEVARAYRTMLSELVI